MLNAISFSRLLIAFLVLTVAVAVLLAIRPPGDIGSGAPVQASIPPSQSPPGGLDPARVPMFVLFGSDDNNRAGGVEFFVNAFKGRTNPAGTGNPATYDGSPALMSFYLIGTNIFGPNIDDQQWRDQYIAAYRAGHEIGNHGFYGLAGEGPRGTEASWLENWIRPTHDALVRMGVHTEDINGFRAAQDAVDPAMYAALKTAGYRYANSSTTNHSTNLPAYWPGTLENGWQGGPEWEDREFGEHSGIWEVPQTYATGTSIYCDKAWFDPPKSGTGHDWMSDMQETFRELYNGNRAPLSLCLHSQDWGPVNTLARGGANEMNATLVERQEAMTEFVDWLLSGEFPDVRIITHEQLLDWMENPVPLPRSEPDPIPTAVPTVMPQPTANSTLSPTATPLPVRQPPSTSLDGSNRGPKILAYLLIPPGSHFFYSDGLWTPPPSDYGTAENVNLQVKKNAVGHYTVMVSGTNSVENGVATVTVVGEEESARICHASPTSTFQLNGVQGIAVDIRCFALKGSIAPSDTGFSFGYIH